VLPRVHRVAGHSFLVRGLAPGATVVDGGANLGAFAQPLTQRFGASVICLEPVPKLADALAAGGLTTWRLALASTPGPVRLRLYQGTCASLDAGPRADQVGEIEVAGLDLAGLLARLGEPASVALLKLDIEGPESALLLAAEPALLRRFRQITVEFHDFLDPRLAPAVVAAIRHVEAAGFHGFRFSRDNSDWLFVNAGDLPLSGLARGYLRHPYRLARGLLRRIARRLGLGTGWAERNY